MENIKFHLELVIFEGMTFPILDDILQIHVLFFDAPFVGIIKASKPKLIF